MSLFESVLSAVVVAMFMPLVFALTGEAALLQRSVDSMRAGLVRDSFIADSFDAAGPDWGAQKHDVDVDVASAVESWKAMCSSLYPQIKIEISALGFKDGSVLYECGWEGKRKLSVKGAAKK